MNLIVYAVIFLAVAGVIGGAYHTVKKSGYNEAVTELQPKIDACSAEVEKQNKAVASLAAESARRQAQSAVALRKASEAAKVWEGNATKLQAALTGRKPDGPTDCKAAWQEIRKP